MSLHARFVSDVPEDSQAEASYRALSAVCYQLTYFDDVNVLEAPHYHKFTSIR